MVNIASGGNFFEVGDIVDHHNYPEADFPLGDVRFENFIKVIGEFGGHGLVLPRGAICGKHHGRIGAIMFEGAANVLGCSMFTFGSTPFPATVASEVYKDPHAKMH